MPQPPPRSPNDCFHCPQGDKPCPDTYRPGAWLARPSAEPAPAALDRRAGAGVLEASLQQTLRKLREAVACPPTGNEGRFDVAARGMTEEVAGPARRLEPAAGPNRPLGT